MKTLLIGFYDYSWHATACSLENGLLTTVKPDYDIFDAINSYANGHADEHEKEVCEEVFSNYDQVILCDDGNFTVLKG